MSRTLTVLALPVVTLSFAAVVYSGPTGSTSVLSPVNSVAMPQTVVEMRHADTGVPIAVTRTNWQETSDGSPIVPTSPPGRPKR